MVEDIKRYKDLDDPELKQVIHSTYNNEWWMCHKEEIPLEKLTRKERKAFFESEEKAKKIGLDYAREQWESASRIFPEGQNVFLVKDNGKWKVAYHIRSNILYVKGLPSLRDWEWDGSPDYPEDLWMNEIDYPETWYLASDNGLIRKSHNPKGNVLINFAVTGNNEIKAKGALERTVVHQMEIAKEKGLYCHTFTPLNSYPYSSLVDIKEDEVEEYLFRCFSDNIKSPVGIHTHFMAKRKYGEKFPVNDPDILRFRRSRVPYIFTNARLKPDAGYMCSITAYTGPGLDVDSEWAKNRRL